MSTAMNAGERARFLQTLREDPDFRDEVRSLLLGEELLQLPERFAQFAAYVNDFIEEQKTFNAKVDKFIERQEETNAEFRAFIGRQEETNAEFRAFIGRQEETNATVQSRLQSITDDIGDLKGHVAGRIAREMADDIAERLGFEIIQQLNGNDLRQMLRQHNPTDIDPGTRRSFYLADLVANVLDQDGNELFMATEASYTANRRDTDRAVKNAAFLTRFTGLAAVPVIASRQNDRAAQELVEAGTVHWFEFDQRDLNPR